MTEIAPTILNIQSESDAWEYLERAVADKLPEGLLDIDFKGWPILTITLQGDRFNATLTSNVMEGLVELQRNINRTFALLMYNRPTAAILTPEEKALLQFTVKVGKGSSEAKIDLTTVFKAFVERAVDKMEAKHIVGVVLGGALLYCGTVGWKEHLSSRLENKKIEAETEVRIALSQEETKRLQIFSDAVKANPVLKKAKVDADEARNAVLKGARQAEHVSVDGLRLDRDTVGLAVRNKRTHSEERRLDGEYRVKKLDNSPADHYDVRVLAPDNREFIVRLENRFASAKAEWEKLQLALRERAPVYLKVVVKEVRGEVRDAYILSVGESPEGVARR